MESSCPKRLRLQDFLTFEIRQGKNTKIILFRNGLDQVPHLTISFGNVSGEIDIHLTKRSADKEEYISIAKISEKEVQIVISALEPILKKNFMQNIHKIKKVRPGWLGRKGYRITYLDEDATQKLIDKVFPIKERRDKKRKVKREYNLTSETFENYVYSQKDKKIFFYPSILHELALIKYGNPVFAFRIFGKHKPKIIPIVLKQLPNGRFYWFRLDKFIKVISNLGEICFSALKQLLPDDAWTIISRELHLEELQIET
jgi:hypothetical protein